MFPRRRMLRRQTRRVVRRRMLLFGRPIGAPVLVIGMILILLVIALFFRVMRSRGQAPVTAGGVSALALWATCPEAVCMEGGVLQVSAG